MKILLALLLLLASSRGWANGSSGIGTARLPITPMFSAVLSPDFVKVRDGKVYDGEQAIFRLSSVQRSHLGECWVPVKLGAVWGLEYRPGPDDPATNAWVICNEDESVCTKLTPLSHSNHKIPAVIGSLIRNQSQPPSR
jgi:hypothetical protein